MPWLICPFGPRHRRAGEHAGIGLIRVGDWIDAVLIRSELDLALVPFEQSHHLRWHLAVRYRVPVTDGQHLLLGDGAVIFAVGEADPR